MKYFEIKDKKHRILLFVLNNESFDDGLHKIFLLSNTIDYILDNIIEKKNICLPVCIILKDDYKIDILCDTCDIYDYKISWVADACYFNSNSIKTNCYFHSDSVKEYHSNSIKIDKKFINMYDYEKRLNIIKNKMQKVQE